MNVIVIIVIVFVLHRQCHCHPHVKQVNLVAQVAAHDQRMLPRPPSRVGNSHRAPSRQVGESFPLSQAEVEEESGHLAIAVTTNHKYSLLALQDS